MEETITAKFVFGNRSWRAEIPRHSVIGALLAGDFGTAEEALNAMLEDLNDIPGVQASSWLTPAAPDDGAPVS